MDLFSEIDTDAADLASTSSEVARPLSAVFGRDSMALPLLFQVHAPHAVDVLDCTHNKGVMWKGLPYKPVTMDIDPQWGTDIVGDFRDMVSVKDKSFDVIVFDPPHLPVAAASENSSGIWRSQYGLTDDAGQGRDGDNVSDMFAPFLAEAKRVLKPDGVVFAKIVDIVHNHRYQWQHVDLVLAARMVGMTPCDMLVKIDPCGGNLKSGRWQKVHHFKRSHCYWMVIRNSTKCECR